MDFKMPKRDSVFLKKIYPSRIRLIQLQIVILDDLRLVINMILNKSEVIKVYKTV